MVYNPLSFNWDDISEELREKLKREPTAPEIQEELLQKFLNSTNILERKE